MEPQHFETDDAAASGATAGPKFSWLATSRRYHTAFATVGAFPLLVTIVTGCAYRFLRAVLNVDKERIGWLLGLHTFSVAGIGAFYPLLVAFLVFGLALSSALPLLRHLHATYNKLGRAPTSAMARATAAAPWSAATAHRALGYVSLPPLLLFAATGALYTMEKHWGAADKAYMKTMMRWHQVRKQRHIN